MELEELKQAVYATDPAAVLVPPRILRRVLQGEFKVPHLLVQVPHERGYFFDRQVLFRYVEQDELGLEPERMLPPLVILLTRPSAEQLQALGRDAALLRYWRLLFHARVHVALHQRHLEGRLTPADIRSRIEQIGRTEFDEIRTVLQQENYLLPPTDDLSLYIEFAAVYLELRYFRTNLRATYFPAIRDFPAIDQLLAQDLEADALFTQTRLVGAPAPVIRTDTSSDESHDYYWRLMRHAQRAGREGDTVRAAILRTKAARVAPPPLTQKTHVDALADLEYLTLHLQDALKFSPEKAQEWLQVLPALLDKADQGNWPVEAKLLYDLQKVCSEHERKLYALDFVEWALSAGRRPIKRPLSSLEIVRTTKHLRSAAQRLTMARVSDEDRQRLAKLLQSALHDSGERLRERFRPILQGAFYDVGLTAASPPEQVALQKMIEELLDRITENGFFTFSDLRDTLSRNQLKLADLADPHSFWLGDPLLRLDRRLANLMEGVYRPGEFYLRWLESCSSLFFGTASGRFFTLNVVVPFGGALALLLALQIIVGEYLSPPTTSAATTAAAEPARWAPGLPAYGFLPLGIFLLALIHVRALREFFVEAGRRAYRFLRRMFYEVPAELWQLPWLQRLLRSWPALLFYWYLFWPLVILGVLWLNWRQFFGQAPVAVLTFVLAFLFFNSRFGAAISEAFLEMLVLIYGWLRFEVLQGLVRWVNYFFKQITLTLEYVLYTVDEWLRFRSDESQLTMVLRAVGAFLWFPVGYLIRLYFVVLIEPSINPLKLPISSLAFKFLLLLPVYQQALNPGAQQQWLKDHAGWGAGPAVLSTFTILIPTFWLLPSAVAFFIWEMQENWRLFRANRATSLRRVSVGRHGETILQLLKPGFHSGTIPKLFAHLRAAERSAYLTGNWRSARTHRQALHEVARLVQLFVEREFITLLQQSPSWENQPIQVEQIVLSCNRIRVQIGHAGFPQEPVSLAFEERSGWLMGSLQEPGWLKHLPARRLQVMTSALAGLYKIAGVDFVREQLAAVLAPSALAYDITDHQLIIHTDHQPKDAIAYDLQDKHDQLRPLHQNGVEAKDTPVLDARRLFFSRVPLTWQQWVECWQTDRTGQGPCCLLSGGITLWQSEPQSRS